MSYGVLAPDPKYAGKVGDPNWWPYQGPKPTDPNALLMGQQLYGTGLANMLFGAAPDYQPLRPRDPNDLTDRWGSPNNQNPAQNTSAFNQNPVGDGNSYPPGNPASNPPGNPGDDRSAPPAPVLNGTVLQPASMTYRPRGTYIGPPQAMPKPGAAVQPPPGGGLLGTAQQQLSGAPWQAGQYSNFGGSYLHAQAPRGVENYQYPATPGGAVARTQGSGLPPLTTNPAPDPGNGTPVSPEEKRAKALQSGALYQPRQFANYQEAGVTLPYRNQFEQYALSTVQGQPWMPNFSYTSRYGTAPPPLQQKFMGLLGGGGGGGNG